MPSVEEIIQKIKDNAASSLYISGSNLNKDQTSALAEALKTNTQMQIIYLNDIDIEKLKILADGLKNKVNLGTIVLESSNLGQEGALVLADIIKTTPSLQTLRISRNNFGDAGAKILADVLQENNSLRAIDLTNNDIGAEGAKALAEALKINTSLTTMIMSSNHIGDEGAKAFAKALETNNSVQRISLRTNKISDEGVLSIANTLKLNNTISSCKLWGNKIGDEANRALIDALENNYSITDFDEIPGSVELVNRNKIRNDKFQRLSHLIDKYYKEEGFAVEVIKELAPLRALTQQNEEMTIEEKKELDSLLSELPRSTPYQEHPYFKRLIERKIAPFISTEQDTTLTKLLRTLELLDKHQFNFILTGQEPAVTDLKPNTIAFLQTKEKYFDEHEVQREGYRVEKLYFKDSKGVMHERQLNGFDLFHFMKTDNQVPLTTESLERHQSLIQNELHVKGIVRQFEHNYDNFRLIDHAWSCVTTHPLYKASYQKEGDESLFKQFDYFTRWFNDDAANFYYEGCFNQPSDQRTITEAYDDARIKTELEKLTQKMDGFDKKTEKMDEVSTVQVSSMSIFKPVQNEQPNNKNADTPNMEPPTT